MKLRKKLVRINWVKKELNREFLAQLGEENRLLCEEFDRFKKGKANSREENEKLESERVLSKYKERIDELEKMLQDLQQSLLISLSLCK